MGGMTVTAYHLAFTDAMRRHLVGLSANAVMALVTDLGLRGAVHNLTGSMHGVAASTRDLFHIVQAVMPLNQRTTLMTLQAHGVLRLHRRRILAGEGYQSTFDDGDMLFPWSMAGFAVVGSIGCACITGLAMGLLEDLLVLSRMAGLAYFDADIITTSLNQCFQAVGVLPFFSMGGR